MGACQFHVVVLVSYCDLSCLYSLVAFVFKIVTDHGCMDAWMSGQLSPVLSIGT